MIRGTRARRCEFYLSHIFPFSLSVITDVEIELLVAKLTNSHVRAVHIEKNRARIVLSQSTVSIEVGAYRGT